MQEGWQFEQYSLPSKDGRQIAVWKSAPKNAGPSSPAVLIGSGFARSMDHMATMAAYLASQGVCAYRYDALDHVGLSSGSMIDFTLGSALDAMDSVLNWISENHDHQAVGLISNSLSGRIAYRFASNAENLAYLITAVGVVNLRSTLKEVFGADYVAYPPEEMPEHVEFERQKIRSTSFYADALAGDWFTPEGTARDISACDKPIIAYIAEHDEWVNGDEVESMMRLNAPNAERHILFLQGCEHEFGKNPRNRENFLIRVTQTICERVIPHWAGNIHIPSFQALTDQALIERRLQRRRDPGHVSATQQKAA